MTDGARCDDASFQPLPPFTNFIHDCTDLCDILWTLDGSARATPAVYKQFHAWLSRKYAAMALVIAVISDTTSFGRSPILEVV